FYRHYYQPDNAVLLVSGKLEESAVLTLAQNHFGKIPRPSRALRGTYTVEPTQDGERAVTLRRAGDVQIVSALYHMPPGTHPEYAAVDVLVALLDHVPSGRLHKALVETGLASSVFGSERQQREAGFAYFGASLSQSASLETARDALLRVLEGFAKTPVTEEEVELARRRLVNDIELALADSRELTSVLSEYAGIGDWRVLFLHRDRLKKVTAADVQAAATACGVASGMLLRGTQKNSREQLRNRFDRLKANVGVGGDGGSAETVRENLPEVLRLMAEVLRQPSFPSEEFEQLRRASLTGIDTQRSDPGALAGLALARHLNPYPPEHWLYTATLDERSARLKALSLVNYLLGGSSDSRLVRRIREKEGLSYSVGSFLSADSFFERGSFGLFAIYAPQNRARVEAALAEELRKALAEGFSVEEVE